LTREASGLADRVERHVDLALPGLEIHAGDVMCREPASQEIEPWSA
jgi:hypothetical protein